MSQVTQLVLHDLSPTGFGRAALALLAVWWAWVGYTWLINTFDTANVWHEVVVIAAMAAMLVAAAALPAAFTSGALVFGIALLVVRSIQVVKFVAHSSHEDVALRRGTRQIAPAFVAAPARIVAAAFVDSPGRELLWVVAAVIDYGAPAVLGLGGFRVCPSYFVSRHGSIIIIALGEVVVELGGAARDLGRWENIAALLFGVAVMATFWWTYFGLTSGARQRLEQATGRERAHLPRDAYSYLHLPPVAGIMLFAVGAHATIEHATHRLPLLSAIALAGGMALFYLVDVAYRRRDHRQAPADRAVTEWPRRRSCPRCCTCPPSPRSACSPASGFAGWSGNCGGARGSVRPWQDRRAEECAHTKGNDRGSVEPSADTEEGKSALRAP